MQLQIPDALPYFVGALLVILGALRYYHLGYTRRTVEKEDGSVEPSAAARRHMRWGALWILMGLFLVISTLMRSLRS